MILSSDSRLQIELHVYLFVYKYTNTDVWHKDAA